MSSAIAQYRSKGWNNTIKSLRIRVAYISEVYKEFHAKKKLQLELD